MKSLTERKIDEELRLIPYYPNEEVTLPWYQDKDLVKQIDNRDEPYSLDLLRAMYAYLDENGSCYYIEYRGTLVGDVTLQNNGEISITVAHEWQNRHIGRRCVTEILKLAREKGMAEVRANIYSFNEQSRMMFRAVGFSQTAEEWFAFSLNGDGALTTAKENDKIRKENKKTTEEKTMDLIPSFQVDHTKIVPGIYESRLDRLGDEYATTFDIRMKTPNKEPVIHPNAMHTIEHVVATFLRNDAEWKDRIIYWGPMGCLTGSYLIVKGHPSGRDLLPLLIRAFRYLSEYEGEVPGSNPKNCGNYLLHDLTMARYEAKRFLEVLESNPCFEYPTDERITTEKGEIFFDS